MKKVLYAFFLYGWVGALWSSTVYLHAGKLIDGYSGVVRGNTTIIVEDEVIRDVKTGFLEPKAGVEVINLRGYTVMPGFMDMHVHITDEFSERSYIEGYQLDAVDYALRGVAHAEKTLLAGFTTIRNLGDSDNETVALRDAIKQGYIIGPRIYTAGKSIATTGGHADPTNGLSDYLRDAVGEPGPGNGVINGPWDAVQAIRQHYQDRVDLIKITATGGVLSQASSGKNPQFFMEELHALVQAANDYGFYVAAHAHGAEGMLRAVEAGVRSIEHGTYMNDQVIRAMKKHGTYYVPTISAGKWVAEKAAIDGFFPEVVRGKAAAIGPQISATFTRAYRAGVKIAFGTDTGVSAHGDNAQEFVYMVEGGMPPMEAIQSATRVAATLLGVDDKLGTIQEGKLADIVAVRGDPIENIAILKNVQFVMLNGKVIKLQ